MNSEKKQKIANLLTVCIKAGKTIKGFDTVCDAVKAGNVFCVMTASDASEKTVKETAFICSKYTTDMIGIGLTKAEIGCFSGKNTAVIAVCDKGFADKFKEYAADPELRIADSDKI